MEALSEQRGTNSTGSGSSSKDMDMNMDMDMDADKGKDKAIHQQQPHQAQQPHQPSTPVVGDTSRTVGRNLSMRKGAVTNLPSDCNENSQRSENDNYKSQSRSRRILQLEDSNDSCYYEGDKDGKNKQQPQQFCHQSQGVCQPLMGEMHTKYRAVPSKYKAVCVLVWIVYKILVFVFVVCWLRSGNGSNGGDRRSSSGSGALFDNRNKLNKKTRILYIVTSLAEFNNGKRNTIKGQDRLGELVLPVLVDGVESMTDPPFDELYQVDVYMILAYQLSPLRYQEIRDRLPPDVGLQVWDDACPLSYDSKKKKMEGFLVDNTRALARQHRYVVKDKIPYYDVFVTFEDDMRITAHHVQHYLEMSHQLQTLREKSKSENNNLKPEPMQPNQQRFHGPMSDAQLDRLMPGFVRVEVLLDPVSHGAQKRTELDPIPINYTTATRTSLATTSSKEEEDEEEQHFNPRYCCNVHMSPNKESLPLHPQKEDVVIWETSVKALSARQLPQISQTDNTDAADNDLVDWVALLPGPGKRLKPKDLIGGYWSGRDGAYGDASDAANKPTPGTPDLIAQQGGWMLTRTQILTQLQRNCMGSFLPPFDSPTYRSDGQESNNVEFWSGGYQLFTGVLGGCNMQRLVTLSSADSFSRHFLYHVANNKQKQLAQKRMVVADHFWGQLNTVLGRAQTTASAEAQTAKFQQRP